MIENPQIGGEYWFIIDIHEVLLPASVSVAAYDPAGDVYTVHWVLVDDDGTVYVEEYDGVSKQDLFDTEAAACEQIRKDRGRNHYAG